MNMENMEKELFKKIDTYKQTVIDLQTNMIACPAVSPSDGGKGEGAKAAYLLSVLKQMKFDELSVINIKDPKAEGGVRPNIVAKYYGENKKNGANKTAEIEKAAAGNKKENKKENK